MSFRSDTHNTFNLDIDDVQVALSVWIQDFKYSKQKLSVSSVLVVEQGRFRLQIKLNAHDANLLIEGLQQHIEHIKEAEIELIAQNAKAAA